MFFKKKEEAIEPNIIKCENNNVVAIENFGVYYQDYGDHTTWFVENKNGLPIGVGSTKEIAIEDAKKTLKKIKTKQIFVEEIQL